LSKRVVAVVCSPSFVPVVLLARQLAVRQNQSAASQHQYAASQLQRLAANQLQRLAAVQLPSLRLAAAPWQAKSFMAKPSSAKHRLKPTRQ